jgi:NADPH:quinone reductase
MTTATGRPTRVGAASAVIRSPRGSRVARGPVPAAGPGEVLVRLEGCGVCASSLPVWEGRPWFEYPLEAGAPGHEGWGFEVVSRRRVALLSQHAFAEYEVVREEHVVPLPSSLDGLPFPGEALGCAMNVFVRSGVRAGDDVAVVGAGFLGLLVVQLCVDAGASVSVFTRRASSLAAARRFGAATPAVAEDERYDVVVEAAGVQETLDLASRLCRVRGRLVVAGYHQDGGRSVDMQLWNWRGLDVVNAHERDPAAYLSGMTQAAAAAAEGRLDPASLYTHVLPLARLDDAFRLVQQRPEGFVKALVVTDRA